MKAKKKIQVKTVQINSCFFCHYLINDGVGIIGDYCRRPRDARRSFVNLCNRLGIPRKNYEFI